MQRRLYFLFPDAEHTLRVVNELRSAGFTRLHTLAQHGIPLGRLPHATRAQEADTLHRLGQRLWNINLRLFFALLAGLLVSLWAGQALLALLCAALMATSFLAGLWATHLPDASLQEFQNALVHGEILLMVDVATRHVTEVEERVYRLHPEAVVGGVSWLPDAPGTL